MCVCVCVCVWVRVSECGGHGGCVFVYWCEREPVSERCECVSEW